MNPREFSFSFEYDPDIGPYVQFNYLGSHYVEDVWDELESFIDREQLSLYRLEESSYEMVGIDQEGMRDDLINLGLREA